MDYDERYLWGLFSRRYATEILLSRAKLDLSIDEEEDIRFSTEDEHHLVNIVIVVDRTATKKGLFKNSLFPHQRILY